MKKLKVILSVLIVAVLALGVFAACGGNDTTDTDTDADVKTLVMATNATFPPYEYKDGESFKGIDVELAELIAEKLGMELEIEDVEFGTIIGGVQTGKFDIGMAGMTVTEERLESVNFSDSYAKGVQSVIVKEDSDLTIFDDVYSAFDDEGNPTALKDGIKIGVQQDTTGDIYCSSAVEEWGVGEDNVVRFKTGADAVQALVSGKVSAVVIDNEPAKSFVAANEGLKILDTAYTEEDYAIAVAKENTELLDNINAALKALAEEGKVAEIIEKYIPAE
ncbi:MAG: transporter substrate-binding domain-containing protein [Acutalibacteraceae bacterium]